MIIDRTDARRKRRRAYHNERTWHPVFAWCPTRLYEEFGPTKSLRMTHRWAWLEMVERKKVNFGVQGYWQWAHKEKTNVP